MSNNKKQITNIELLYKDMNRQARTLTLEDLETIRSINDGGYWPYNTSPYLWMAVNPEVRYTHGFWISWSDVLACLRNKSPFYDTENYETIWILWTAEPTEEQRKNHKWKQSGE